MLRWRILLGALLIASLAGLAWLDFTGPTPCLWLIPVVLVVGMAAAQEVIALLGAGGFRPAPLAIYGGTLLVLVSNAVPLFWLDVPDDQPLERLGWPLLAFVLSFLAVLLAEMIRYQKPGTSMVHIGLATFAIAYVGLLFSFVLQLRVLGGPVEGMIALLAMLVVVKAGDTGAYTVGRLFGRHKMAPLISPGKTWQGAAGAVGFSLLGAWLALTYLPLWLGGSSARPGWVWIVFGLVVSVAGMLGDLAESLLKRDMGRKDSSTWLPGFGGVLDLLDSILFAAPVAYLCWLLSMI